MKIFLKQFLRYLRNMKRISYKYFLSASLFFGLIYIFIVPPFQAPDEDNHFFRSYEILNPDKTDQSEPQDRLGGYLPASLFEYSNQFRYLRFNYDGKISKEQIHNYSRINLDKVNIAFTDFSNTAMYFPTSYPLQALFASIGAKLNLKPSVLLYLLRFASLLTWIGFLYCAYKIFLDENHLFLLISSLPAILVLHSSITADAITNGLAFFLFAYVLNLRSQLDSISVKHILIFSILISIISLNKIVYFPLVLLWFFLPSGKFVSLSKYYAYFIVISVICIGITSIWALKVNEAYINYEEYDIEYRDDQQIKPNGNPTKQLEYIIAHPVKFSKNVISSYLSVVPATAAHLTGKFGWEKNYIPAWMIAALLITLLCLIFNLDFALNLKHRLLLITISLSTLLLLAIMMYGIYNPVGNNYIFNLGGRYLFPIFPLLAFAFSKSIIKFEIKTSWLFYLICFAHITMIVSIINRYYF